MKRVSQILFSIAVVLFLASCATVDSPDPEDMIVERVITFPDMEQDELYDLTNRWFVHSFGRAQAVIDYQDKDRGIVMGKYTYRTSVLGPLAMSTIDRVECTIQVEVRDGRARVQIMDPSIRLSSGTYGSTWRSPNRGELERIEFHRRSEETIETLIAFVNDHSDW
jgi:hypothetical protein